MSILRGSISIDFDVLVAMLLLPLLLFLFLLRLSMPFAVLFVSTNTSSLNRSLSFFYSVAVLFIVFIDDVLSCRVDIHKSEQWFFIWRFIANRSKYHRSSRNAFHSGFTAMEMVGSLKRTMNWRRTNKYRDKNKQRHWIEMIEMTFSFRLLLAHAWRKKTKPRKKRPHDAYEFKLFIAFVGFGLTKVNINKWHVYELNWMLHLTHRRRTSQFHFSLQRKKETRHINRKIIVFSS